MTWREALEINVSRTGHEKYRAFCDEDHPQRDVWRREMLRLAGDELPPIRQQLANAAIALGRAASSLAAGNGLTVSQTELDRRLSICESCHQLRGLRCVACGCFVRLKARLESETGQCPDGKW